MNKYQEYQAKLLEDFKNGINLKETISAINQCCLLEENFKKCRSLALDNSMVI